MINQICTYSENEIPGSYPGEAWSTFAHLCDVPMCYAISNYGRIYNLADHNYPAIIVHNGSSIANLAGLVKRAVSISIAKTELMVWKYYDGCEKDWAVFLDGNKANLKLNNLAWKKKPRLPYPVCFYPTNIPLEYQEQWRWITGQLVPGIQEGSYMISNYGRVYSAFSNRLLVLNEDSNGYYYIKVNLLNGKFKNLRVNILVAELFVYNPHPYAYDVVNHIDGNKHNNCAWNLEWCTVKQNNYHALKNGLVTAVGENSPRAKLTEEDVIKICGLINEGKYNYEEIGKMFNVTGATIGNIASGSNWSSVTHKYLKGVKNKWE